MKNQDVEQRLKKDVEEITPNVIDSALEKCGGVSQREIGRASCRERV